MIKYISKYNLVARIRKIFNRKKIKYEKNFYNRIAFLNKAISKYDYNTVKYLEIGVDKNLVFNSIPIPIVNKIGVDPIQGGTHRMKSEDFFKKNFYKFDIIFIDGDHNYEQVRDDFIECLKILNPRGIIFLHDVLPRSELEQTIPQKIDIWTGDVWKLILELIENSKTLEIYIANIDCGVCMIKSKDNVIFGNTINYKNLSYEDFIERLYKKANILESEEFIKRI
jgi:hypothetical protein